MRVFLRQLRPAFLVAVVFTVICGLIYPMVTLAIGQVAFKDKANGSLITVDGKVVGSRLLGQSFSAPQYFHPRPSAAGAGYDGSQSSGSNLGPNNADFLSAVADRVKAYRTENGLSDTQLVPVDAVTASGSGLDPDISIANARLQEPRVAAARNLTVEQVAKLVDQYTDGRDLGVLGEPGVNVLELNVALDATGGG
ncbi:MAG: kdpC [Ilumatobacteraceae bacterium]|nr:kdpC [Ilumatobacteraceae bacterium]